MTAKALVQENAAEWVRNSLEEFEIICEQCMPPKRRNRRALLDTLDIPEGYPFSFINLIDDFLRLYRQEVKRELVEEVIQSAQSYDSIDEFLDHLENTLDKPSYEFMPPAPRFSEEQDEQLFTRYMVRAALYFNEVIPIMREGGFAAVEAETLYLFQRAMEHAVTTYLCLDFYAQFQDYEPPYRRQRQSRNGGKARAEKLYGARMAYIKRRFVEIRTKGAKLSLDKLYRSQAAEELINIRYQLIKIFDAGGETAVREHLQEAAETRLAARLNSWQSATYEALALNEWFCSEGFR